MDTRLEQSKINYNASYGVSEQTFAQVACEILDLPVERVEVRRCIMMGNEFGRLTVYIYKESDERKLYYQINNGTIQHRNLSPNICEFKTQLNRICKK